MTIREELDERLKFYRSMGVRYLNCVSGEGSDLCGGTESLDELREKVLECTACPLHKTRTKVVFGDGNTNAQLMFVGEAPGRDEDLQGEPFVGKAGQLLTKIIEAIDLQRKDVYIGNIIKCRPPENRDPALEEIQACRGFIEKQIDIINPKVIVTLGAHASRSLLEMDLPISKLRGRFRDYKNIPLMPTFHPAYLLRNPAGKREVWADMQKVRDRLRES